ncbi:HNH endonuclease [Sphingomonas sp. LK11]|uniref:HNH endonuclease n=1 Tax=Sphingomonas sp. LK11 TaxID=1390395 RepID=UPI000978C2C5|nr:HNH endonuclease [Sphingomonas sp. LK11]
MIPFGTHSPEGKPHIEWRTIAEFPNYAVSSDGQVKRVVAGHSSPAGKVLKQNTVHGYRYVALSRDGTVYSRRVNRLVCIAFHGEPPTSQHHAAHGDNDRANNTVGNLRWATASENMRDKEIHGTTPFGDRNGARLHPERLARGLRNGKHTKPEATPRGERHGSSRLNSDQVRAIRNDGRSRRQIAIAYGVSKCAIDGIKTGKTWGHVS